jgi:hypothetical protein
VLSPRSTAPNQMLLSSPRTTSAITSALGAIQALGWTVGRRAPISYNGIAALSSVRSKVNDVVDQAGFQSDVL